MKNSFGIIVFAALAAVALTFSACEKEAKGYKISGMLDNGITVTKGVNAVKAATSTDGDLLASAEINGSTFTLTLPETLKGNIKLESIQKLIDSTYMKLLGLSELPAKISISDSSALVTGLEFFAYNTTAPVGLLRNLKTSETKDSFPSNLAYNDISKIEITVTENCTEKYIYASKSITISGLDSIVDLYFDTEKNSSLRRETAVVFDVTLKAGWNKIYSSFKSTVSSDDTEHASCLLTVNTTPIPELKWVFGNQQPEPVNPSALVGRWKAEKIVSNGVTQTNGLQYIYFQFNANNSCVFNIEGLQADDDIFASYLYWNNRIVLTADGGSITVNVIKLTETELVLTFPPLEAGDTNFTVYYKKA